MKISIVAAIGKNRELGKDNRLLWYIPEDLKRFKKLTQNHPIIMGRKTYESIGKPLPNRTNIIITRDPSFQAPNCIVTYSLEEALDVAKGIEKNPEVLRESHLGGVTYLTPRDSGEIFIIGGGQIFEQALPLTDKLYLTIVDGVFDADTFFPDYSMFTKIVSQVASGGNGYRYTFLDIEK